LIKWLKSLWYPFVRVIVTAGGKTFWRLKFYGTENIPKEGAFLLLSNHQSFLDPILCAIASKRDLSFMARDTLFEKKLLSGLMKSLNAIPVKRGEADVAAMKSIIAKLKEGTGVCLYPEGTRTQDGKIAKVKPGFGLLTRRGKAGVVPMVIDGMFELWPKGQKYPKRGAVNIMLGNYYSPEQIKQAGEQGFADQLTEELRSMQAKLREMANREVIKYDD